MNRRRGSIDRCRGRPGPGLFILATHQPGVGGPSGQQRGGVGSPRHPQHHTMSAARIGEEGWSLTLGRRLLITIRKKALV